MEEEMPDPARYAKYLMNSGTYCLKGLPYAILRKC